MAVGTQIVVQDHLAGEARPDNGVHLTAVACNSQVHLLALLVLLYVWVLETSCNAKIAC